MAPFDMVNGRWIQLGSAIVQGLGDSPTEAAGYLLSPHRVPNFENQFTKLITGRSSPLAGLVYASGILPPANLVLVAGE